MGQEVELKCALFLRMCVRARVRTCMRACVTISSSPFHRFSLIHVQDGDKTTAITVLVTAQTHTSVSGGKPENGNFKGEAKLRR